MDLDIRITGVCYGENDDLLIIEQAVNGRSYSLPGGRMQSGETVEATLIREMHEEVGLDVSVGGVVYVSEYDRPSGRHVIEIAMAATWVSGQMDLSKNPEESEPITKATFVHLDDLERCFSEHPKATELLAAIRAGRRSQGRYLGIRTA